MTNNYIVWAPSGVAGTNVYSAAAYAALASRTLGVVPGVADPLQANTAWRQSSVAAAAIAQFTVDNGGGNMLDDGNAATFQTNFTLALSLYIKAALAAGIPIRTAKTTVTIASTTANIDFSLGNYFVVLMNANLATLTFSNFPPSGVEQEVTVDFVADGTDHGHAFLSESLLKWMNNGAVTNTPPTFVYTSVGAVNTVVFKARDGVTTRVEALYSGTSPA